MAEKIETTQSAANKRYTRAVAALKKAHANEFQTLLAAEWTKDGAAYRPRLTPAERDAKTVAEARAKAAEKAVALMATYPDLSEEEILAAKQRLAEKLAAS